MRNAVTFEIVNMCYISDSFNHEFMLVMQGNELAVSLGFVGEVVLFSSPCFGKKKNSISVFLFQPGEY